VSSDLHRAFLTRLCGAFRLSQPLDALLRSRPTRLVSCGIRSWVSRPSEDFPPRLARNASRRRVPLVSLPCTQRDSTINSYAEANVHRTNRQHPVTLRRSAKPGYPRMLASIRPLTAPPKRVDLHRHADDPDFDRRSDLRPGPACSRALRRSAGVHEHRGELLPAAEATDRNVRHMNPRT